MDRDFRRVDAVLDAYVADKSLGPGRRTFGPCKSGVQPIDPSAQRGPIFLEVKCTFAERRPRIAFDNNSNRCHVFDVRRQQREPFLVPVFIEQTCFVRQPLLAFVVQEKFLIRRVAHFTALVLRDARAGRASSSISSSQRP